MKPALVAHVAELIRSKRVEKNMNQGELAKVIGTTRQSICAYERGRFLPQVQLMVKLAVTLDIDLNSLKEI